MLNLLIEWNISVKEMKKKNCWNKHFKNSSFITFILKLICKFAQSTGAAKYTDCTSAEG